MLPITSQDGNVIAADFRTRAPSPQPASAPSVSFKSTILYADAHVCLIRIAYFWGEALIGIQHVMSDTNNQKDSPA